MAQLVVAAAGAALGGAFLPAGFLGFSGASIGFFFGNLVAGALFPPPNQQGPRLGDLRVAGTDYGQVVPLVYGSPRLSGQMYWASEIYEIENEQSVGKGGGQKYTSYTYEVDLIFGIADNVTDGISRVWRNGDLVRGTTTQEGVWAAFTPYTGADGQLPDANYEADVGPGQAPAFLGQTSAGITRVALGNSKQIPNFTFKIGNINRTDGVQIYAPFNTVTQYQDLIPVPQRVQTTGGVVEPPIEFTDGGARLDQGDVNFGYYQEKFEPGQTNTVDAWLSFEYSFEGTIGSGPVVRSSFFQLSRNAIQSTELNVLVDTDPSAWEITFFTQAPVSENVTTPLPTSGKIELRWPANTADRIELYVNEEYRGRVVFTGLDPRSYDQAYFLPPILQPGNLKSGAVSFKEFYFSIGNRPGVITEAPELLYLVIEDLLLRAGYERDEFDISDIINIEQRVRGLVVAQASTTRAILEVLQTAFFFDVFEDGDRLVFRRRQNATVHTLTYEDLAATESDDPEEAFVLDISSELEVPAQTAVRFNNVLEDYNIGTAYSDRGESSSQESVEILDLPLGLTPAEASIIAEARNKDQIASLGRVVLRLPMKWTKIKPGDIIECPDKNGRMYRLRVAQRTDQGIIQELECVLNADGVLDQLGITDNNYLSVTEPARIAASDIVVVETSNLRNEDVSDPVYYVGVTNDKGVDDLWPGAVVVRARTGDQYEELFIASRKVVAGTTVGTLGGFNGGSNRFDFSTVLRVEVEGELSSSTREDVLRDRTINAVIVGGELIRYVSANLIGVVDGVSTYDLTMLLRGQLGTEEYINTHTADERFALLDSGLRPVFDDPATLGRSVKLKAQTLNLKLSEAAEVPFTNTGKSMLPRSPANLRALASGGDVVVTWNRRTRAWARYGGPLVPSVPLAETTEEYTVVLCDLSDNVLVPEVRVTVPTYTYTAAVLAGAGLSAGDPYVVRVAQRSSVVGAGVQAVFRGVTP